MPTVETFDAYGKRFKFEPPIEVGDHTVDSLSKLVAIAVRGHDAEIRRIDNIAKLVNQSLEIIYEHDGADELPIYLSLAASTGSVAYRATIEH